MPFPRMTSFLAFSILLFSAGCSDEAGRETDSDGGGGAQSCGAIGKSRGVSQACCLSYGVDACGAGLFCAAFDGRTQPTCYLERSRPDMASCNGERQCVSGTCNATAGKCKSTPLMTCDPAIGCSSDPAGTRYGCDPRTQPNTCKPIDKTAGFCVVDTDCSSKLCKDHVCTCLPSCTNKQCGSDGCGGSCGSCAGDETCSSSGTCVNYCADICAVLLSPCKLIQSNDTQDCINICKSQPQQKVICAWTAAKATQCSKIMSCYAGP